MEITNTKRKKKAKEKSAKVGISTTVKSKKRKQLNIDNKLKLYVAVFVLLLCVAAVSITFFTVFLNQDLCDFSDKEPTEYYIQLCARIEDGKECTFNADACSDGCVLGYEQNEDSCDIGCNCASQGLFETDIRFNPSTIEDVLAAYITVEDSALELSKTSSVSTGTRLWDLNINDGRTRVPYVLAPTLFADETIYSAVLEAFEHYSNKTCIDFRPRQDELDYLEIGDERKGCSSHVGRKGGRQFVSIGRRCARQGTVQHEFLHALGFYHEQSRPDRDGSVTIHFENINKAKHHNFRARGKNNVRNLQTPYDLGSVMQYGGHAFSKNGKATITVDATEKPVVSQRKGFSAEDLFEVNNLYLCQTAVNTKLSQVGDSWEEWGPWQQCSASCGGGLKARLRECVSNDNRVVHSNRCAGKFFEYEPCTATECVQGLPGPWSSCDVTCGSGRRRRQNCCYPKISYNTEACVLEPCKQDIANWGEWESWSKCSRTCGNGFKRRSRSCIDILWNEVPENRCPWVQPSAHQVILCSSNVTCVESSVLNFIGLWDDWSEWTPCSRTCGTGVHFRKRVCPRGTCTGDKKEMATCTISVCPTKETEVYVGNWGPWSAWSLCICVESVNFRQRTCFGRNFQIRTDCEGGFQNNITIDEATRPCKSQHCSQRPTKENTNIEYTTTKATTTTPSTALADASEWRNFLATTHYQLYGFFDCAFIFLAGDVSGDESISGICFQPNKLYAQVISENATKCSAYLVEIEICPGGSGQIHLGDYDGDGKDDAICFNPISKQLRITFAGAFYYTGVGSSQHDFMLATFCTDPSSTFGVSNTDIKADFTCAHVDGTITRLLNQYPECCVD